MLSGFEQIVAICPGGAVTGGPEAIHQLVNTLRELGHDARISYYPFEQTFECPAAFARYDAPQGLAIDDSSTFIILPEVATQFVNLFRHAQVAVWWLSVDNYFRRKKESWAVDVKERIYSRIKRTREPISNLRHHIHFAQSHYAANFLKKHGLSYYLLMDYLNFDHQMGPKHEQERENIILYNPAKGEKIGKRVREANTVYCFRPIENMTSTEVACALARAKIYADFGHHPGRDRLPREAASAGCCVITLRRGAAAVFEDMPIPKMYKLSVCKPRLARRFHDLVESVLPDLAFHSSRLEAYRRAISKEPLQFRQQVAYIFGVQS